MPDPDLSEFEALSNPKYVPCQIGELLGGSELNNDEKAQLEAALAKDKSVITGAAIEGWLKKRGHEVNVQRISVHRRGVCRCGRA